MTQLKKMTDIKISIKGVAENLELNNIKELSILTGTNGSGKSLTMKCIWLMNTLVTLLVHEAFSNKDLVALTDIFQKTFRDCDFTGEMRTDYEMNSLSITFEDGKITYCLLAGPDIDPNSLGRNFYLSTKTRLLDSWEDYLFHRQSIPIEKLAERYALYDLTFLEFTYMNLQAGINLSDIDLTSFFSVKDHIPVNLFLKGDKIYFTRIDGIEKHISSLSSGEQSIITMLFTAKNS